MRNKQLKSSFIYVSLVILSLCFNSLRGVSQVLQFKVMVVKRNVVDSLFRDPTIIGGLKNIIFRHANKLGQEDTDNRYKYHLTAYCNKSNGNFRRIRQNLIFVPRQTTPKFIPFPSEPSSFSNLILKRDDIPTNLRPTFRYIIFVPVLFTDDNDYVMYKYYLAEDPEDVFTFSEEEDFASNLKKQISIKRVFEITNTALNPSPPR